MTHIQQTDKMEIAAQEMQSSVDEFRLSFCTDRLDHEETGAVINLSDK